MILLVNFMAPQNVGHWSTKTWLFSKTVYTMIWRSQRLSVCDMPQHRQRNSSVEACSYKLTAFRIYMHRRVISCRRNHRAIHSMKRTAGNACGMFITVSHWHLEAGNAECWYWRSWNLSGTIKNLSLVKLRALDLAWRVELLYGFFYRSFKRIFSCRYCWIICSILVASFCGTEICPFLKSGILFSITDSRGRYTQLKTKISSLEQLCPMLWCQG